MEPPHMQHGANFPGKLLDGTNYAPMEVERDPPEMW
eukprot:CAMPEP_0174747452 /NCGR_PEP_ID=MMETSP1094-20130205/91251_1 /TAXON_ID=156173 /ORGANISM="Chrysochromulina brevifilum, Strain UTEX LB 985" /LENGTH=35 /DNA_ID= /DNA_START= /DNA_END= /DNA_ORIENTATION=